MGRVKLHMDDLIYIHGTTSEGRLGAPASHGCIRMSNADVVDLARRLHRIATPVDGGCGAGRDVEGGDHAAAHGDVALHPHARQLPGGGAAGRPAARVPRRVRDRRRVRRARQARDGARRGGHGAGAHGRDDAAAAGCRARRRLVRALRRSPRCSRCRPSRRGSGALACWANPHRFAKSRATPSSSAPCLRSLPRSPSPPSTTRPSTSRRRRATNPEPLNPPSDRESGKRRREYRGAENSQRNGGRSGIRCSSGFFCS